MMNGKHKKTQKNQRATHMRQAATVGATQSTPYWDYELTFNSETRDVIGYVTIRFPIRHFLLVVIWKQVSAAPH